jgi:hypothetical protein
MAKRFLELSAVLTVLIATASGRAQQLGTWAAMPSTTVSSTFSSADLNASLLQTISGGASQTSDTACIDLKDQKACEPCCPPPWAHRTGVFGQYMLLRPDDVEVTYAVQMNGPITAEPNLVQVAPAGIVDPDFSSGFRAGGSLAMDQCTSLVLTYSHFESDTSNVVFGDAAFPLRSLVLHPGLDSARYNYQQSAAQMAVDFDTVDVDYRAILMLGDCSVVNWFAGARYVSLEQDFASQNSLTGTIESLMTDIDFDGGGLRLGLDASRYSGCGFLLYGKGAMSLVAGEFNAVYEQTGSQQPEPRVYTEWEASRIVSILDVELGAGWQSRCGRARLTAGYQLSYWFNAVTTDQWIRAVHASDFVGQPDGMSYDTVSFDGFVVHGEVRF